MRAERLVSWTTFISASAYERKERTTWDSLQDLSAVADILCLYDRLAVIGDPHQPAFLGHQTAFFDALRHTNAVHVSEPDAATDTTVRQLARQHAALVTGIANPDLLEEEIERARRTYHVPADPGTVAAQSRGVRSANIDESDQWGPEHILRFLTETVGPKEVRNYVSRTFYYYAYAELMQLPWVPDSSRSRLATLIVSSEASLASELLTKLEEQWKRSPRMGSEGVSSRVSPFGALLLERCQRNRDRIPDELIRLRDEFYHVRQRVAELEHTMREGFYEEVKRAEETWRRTLAEIETAYGPSSARVTLRSGLAAATQAVEIVVDPADPTLWKRAILNLPWDAILRWKTRRPITQIFRMRKELPGHGRLERAILETFPEMNDTFS